MAIALLLLMATAAVALVAWPLLRPGRERGWGRRWQEQQEELREQRDAIYATIADLELDYQAGKLTEGDYHRLLTSYRRKAIATLQAMDALAPGSPPDSVVAAVEQEVAEWRQRHQPPNSSGD